MPWCWYRGAIDSAKPGTIQISNTMKIKEPSLAELIAEVNAGKIMLPGFQREYVWDAGKISELLISLLKSRPIGMATSWLQPESRPHTEPLKFSLRDEQTLTFGEFSNPPAITSLVLDGRQRITTLLHVFTKGFYPKSAKYSHANRWFVTLDKELGEDGSIKSVKINKLKEQGLDSVSACLAQGWYPLDCWAEIVMNTHRLYDDSTYPQGKKPDEQTLLGRTKRLQSVSQTLMAFKFPIAEIGDHFGLSDVCEIFEILNTTGTKVSVFDLIHTFLFQFGYDLRETHGELKKAAPGIYVFGEADPVYYSQLVTAAWIAQKPNLKPLGRDGKVIEGIKAGSLLNTPKEAYTHFESALNNGELSAALDRLYSAFGGKFNLQAAAYPITFTLFFSVMLSAETEAHKRRLCQLFRAFYYRNSLRKRYTEGYLTKYIADLEFLHNTIRLSRDANFEAWAAEANAALDDHMRKSGEAGEPTSMAIESISEQLLSSELTAGAQHQLYTTYLLCRHNLDLLTGERLDIEIKNPDDKSVEIHHVYPKQWLAKNKAGREEQASMVDCFANKVPLTRISNNFWKDKAPNTVLSEKNKTWSNSASQFQKCKIGTDGFKRMADQPTAENITHVWQTRARAMADEIFHAQQVDFNGFEAP